MKLTIDLPDELCQRLLSLSPPLDVASICCTALTEALKRKTMTQKTELDSAQQPLPKKMGRPPGRTREKRTINLEPRLWAWLEARAKQGETFNDTCNRIIEAATAVLP